MSFTSGEYLLLLSTFIIILIFIVFIISKTREIKLLKRKNYLFEQYFKVVEYSNIVSKGDLKGNITFVNDKFCEISQYKREELIGKPHSIIKAEENREIFKEMWTSIMNKQVWRGVLKNRKKNGDFYWIDVNISPILDENGKIIEYIAIRHEITDLVQKTEKLKRNLREDFLTNIGNRYKLIEDISKFINPCIAILDIVNFSDVNDFFGYKNGDVVLKLVTQKISELLKDQNNYELYRDYSDIFCIVAQDEPRDKFIKNVENLVKTIFKTPILLRGREIFIQLSYVFSFEPKETLLETAYMIKKYAVNNKNINIYDKDLELEKEYEKNLFWAFKIKKAIDEDKIVPYFQAIYDLKTNKIEKYEVLIRLVDGNNVISPYYFLDISKKSKQYLLLTKIMIQKSFDYFKDNNFNFSINLTFEDIESEYIVSYIVEMLENYKIGHKVIFEIVESEDVDFVKISKFFEIVRSFGCRIAIDDFGSGYSNFEYLLQINVDFLKIDGSLVKDILVNKSSQNIVSMLVSFAKDQGIKTIAEFVSNEEIFDKVKELGIDYAQGYYIKEPMANTIEIDN